MNPAIKYTRNTQQALIDLDASLTVAETWEAIYSIVFSIRYSIEPRPYTQLRQELYNAYILTDTFRKDPFEELYQISEANVSTDSDSSTESFDIPDNFHPLLHGLLLVGPLTPGLLFTDEPLYLDNLFDDQPAGLLFIEEDLHLNFLFQEPEPAGLLFADEDLHLDQLFEEPEVPAMAAVPGGFNPNILLNALNNLTNALGAGGNNWVNVNNAVNTLNATLTANNNAMQNRGNQAAQAAIDRARACELTLKEGKRKPSNYVTIQSETTELAKIVSTLVTQVGELTKKVEAQPARYRNPRTDDQHPRDNANNRNATANNVSVICYTCGQPGHISRRCSNKGTNNSPAYPAERNRPVTRSHPYIPTEEKKETSPPVPNVVREAIAEIKEMQPEGSTKPATEKGKGTVVNPTNPTTTNPVITRPKKKVVTRKKATQKTQPSISAHIQPYNIVADLQQQRANISFGQLFQISPKLRSDVGKSLRKPGTRSSKMVAQFSNQYNLNATALYCDATVKGREIPLIIDSGAAGKRRRKREEEDRDEEEDDVSEEEENEEDETEEEEYEEEDLDKKILAAREFIRKKILSLQTKEFIWMSPSTSGRTSPGWTNNSERSHLSERLGYTIGKDLPPVVGVVNDYTRRAILVQDVMGKSPIL
ncbi:unnamed protein product [Rhizophagus irregularis]|nr:unnamed protein product [Rhizophagus irregularis]